MAAWSTLVIEYQFPSIAALTASYGDFFEGGVLAIAATQLSAAQAQLGHSFKIRIGLPNQQWLTAQVEVIALAQGAQQWPWLLLRFIDPSEQTQQYIDAFLSHAKPF
ncbi:hypothetical protein [Idiomarina xiamenensis]|uniref:Uncharacterized protein n=1 Tax=Idiomarina xiamenensis 10-D-4 TaxID=740709 RepID=K2KJT4_9GAMM|nr:hypothetical protein [Idiomarina xiamenensis]EKE86957.1 hypothetical protein A10D4_01907 [Idiomarina xiamenensis 10-D-4]